MRVGTAHARFFYVDEHVGRPEFGHGNFLQNEARLGLDFTQRAHSRGKHDGPVYSRPARLAHAPWRLEIVLQLGAIVFKVGQSAKCCRKRLRALRIAVTQ